jgi:hypothetical protein
VIVIYLVSNLAIFALVILSTAVLEEIIHAININNEVEVFDSNIGGCSASLLFNQ